MYRKIDISSAAVSNVSEDAAKELVDHRINIKKPFTQRAFDRAMKQAAICGQKGINPDEAIEITIDKGWQGVVVEYVVNEVSRRKQAITQGVPYENGQQRTGQSFRASRSERADQQMRELTHRPGEDAL
jgi:hypothetical protein